MSKKVDKWIYKSNIEQTVIIRPTVTTHLYNQQGTPIVGSETKRGAIKLVFDSCHAMVDDGFAKKNRIELADLIQLIENEPGFGTNFWCIQSPKKEATKEEKVVIEKAPKKAEIIHGARR